MSHVEREIASQPECWKTVIDTAGQSSAALPSPGERVAVVGAGTSWFMAMVYAQLREAAGHGETDAYAASEFPTTRRYDRVVAITRSGTTTEVLDLLAGLPDGTRTTAITAVAASPVSARAEAVVALPFADEESVVQTRFATSATALLRVHLGHDLTGAIADAVTVLDEPLPVHPASVEQVTFLGTGWTLGLAHEAALKCREAANLWTEAYPAMDYRHGPISIAAPGRIVWAFGSLPDGLTADIQRTGATFLHTPDRDPLAELVMTQRVAVAVAVHRGLDPDAPRHLTRSVILR
ncbi:sugar isomerase [Dactylosporangium sp. NPDC049525]|uniref:SIS domain-containing protein n=1 Tax=Dactylosporangium sp. NPDC049525 TaxID=3154730 RepID=UPI003429CBBA